MYKRPTKAASHDEKLIEALAAPAGPAGAGSHGRNEVARTHGRDESKRIGEASAMGASRNVTWGTWAMMAR